MGRDGQNVVARLVSIPAFILLPAEINGKLLCSSIKKKIQQIGKIVYWLVILIIFFVLIPDFKKEKFEFKGTVHIDLEDE